MPLTTPTDIIKHTNDVFRPPSKTLDSVCSSTGKQQLDIASGILFHSSSSSHSKEVAPVRGTQETVDILEEALGVGIRTK
jgi:hypothetical protein